MSVYSEAQAYQQALLAQDAAALRRMADALDDALPRLIAEAQADARKIAAMRAAGVTPSEWQTYARMRSRSIAQQTAAEITRIIASIRRDLLVSQVDAMERGLTAAQRLVEGQVADGVLPAAWQKVNLSAVQAAVGAQQGEVLGTLLDKIGPDAGQRVRLALNTGLLGGQNPRVIARRLTQEVELSAARAEVIARTETLRAFRVASVTAYQANGIERFRRMAAKSTRTCAACLALDGQIQNTDQMMATHPQCFVGETVVSGPRAVASVARWYDGEVIEIETEGADLLTVTPNHPILTTEGWIAAGLLNESSYVIRYHGPERGFPGVDPNDYQIPARIDEVARTAGGARGVTPIRVPVTAEDFHGDGVGSEVCVVRTDSLLRDGFNAAFLEPALKQLLSGRDVRLSQLLGSSNLGSMFECLLNTANGSMSGRSNALPLFGSSLGGNDEVCFRHRAERYALSTQSSPNRVARDAVAIRESFFGGASTVGISDVLFADAHLSSAGFSHPFSTDAIDGRRVAQETARLEFLAKRGFRGMEAVSDVFATFAQNVGVDRVLKFRRRDLRVHVYNLETRVGWYIANGIITHNCRCAVIPLPPGGTNRAPQSGADWFAEQTEETQRRILGKGGFDAYQQGTPLRDFAKVHEDKNWGPTVRTANLKELAE